MRPVAAIGRRLLALLVAMPCVLGSAQAAESRPVRVLHLPGIAGELSHDRRFAAALRRAEPDWTTEIVDWAGARRGLLALLDERGNRAEASRLARRLQQLRRDEPQTRIIVTAHSGGAGIAAWALEQLPADVNIDVLVLLAPALSADYDLSAALRRVGRHALVFSSRHDRLVLGLGTRLLGTIDRRFTTAAGYDGFRAPGGEATSHPGLIQVAYRDEWRSLENAGNHVGALQPRFADAVLAPLLRQELEAGATRPATGPGKPPGPTRVGRIDSPLVPESSGVIASRRRPGVLWTINDGGNPAELHAIDRSGCLLETVPLAVANIDFEDLADDERGNLYVGDIGNNRLDRRAVFVHRFVEPGPRAGGAARVVRPDATWELRYPGQPFDSEALFVWKERGYLVSKRRDLGPAGLYAFDLARREPQTLRRIADLPVLAPVTSADISRDGARIAIGTVGGVFLFRVEPGRLDQLARARSGVAVFIEPMMEAVCFDGDGILATTEKRAVLLFGWDLFAEDLRPRP